MRKHPDVDVVISFASLRSAFDSTMEVMHYSQVEKGQTVCMNKSLGLLLTCLCACSRSTPLPSLQKAFLKLRQESWSRWLMRKVSPSLALLRYDFYYLSHQQHCNYNIFVCFNVFVFFLIVLFFLNIYLGFFPIFRWEASNQAALRSVTLAECWTTSWLLNCIALAVWRMCHDLGECPMN